MGKNEKTGLGRALVKHHAQMIQQSKDKAAFYRARHKKVLESYTDFTDIDIVLENLEHPEPNPLQPPSSTHPRLISLDAKPDMTDEESRKLREQEEAAHFRNLRVPRRPPWNAEMSVEELDANENEAFLSWRRTLASLEENENLILTPFEKNLDIWRQLWRVLERSDLIVMVVDARDPLFYRCPDLEMYAREIDEHKQTLLLVNKADLLPYSVRKRWAEYFVQNDILYIYWSAKAATAALEGKKFGISSEDKMSTNVDTKIYSRDELLSRLQYEAEEIVKRGKHSDSTESDTNSDLFSHKAVTPAKKSVVIGFVGYPNVGKSSTINALVGQKRTGVTSTPGKTKHFQTLIISDKLTLCDCPGLVFPSFSSSRYEMIASGVLPIDRMTEHRKAVQVVANRIPRHVIENVYNIKLPKPKPYEPHSRPPLALELLRAYCSSRGYVASSGLPDETRAARQIMKDFLDGKLPHYKLPPSISDTCPADIAGLSLAESRESDSSDELPDTNASTSEHVLDNIRSFDDANGLAFKKLAAKKDHSSSKHHKKPQRRKDRSWRTPNDDDDGTPVVRMFQKPPIITPLSKMERPSHIVDH